MEDRTDHRLRLAAFDFLDRTTRELGEVLPWSLLVGGFLHEGERVALIGQKGIWKPRALPRMPLSIMTAPVTPGRPVPYADSLDEHDHLLYRFRGTDPSHPDNTGMIEAMRRQAPLIYFFGIAKGQYMPVWPVYVVGADISTLTFRVSVDEATVATRRTSAAGESQAAEGRRAYVTRVTIGRLHQAAFRERVLRAYREHCAVCRLRHRELLDAAHIVPDSRPEGDPVVANGLSLCKLHHAAFDRHILGVRPDLVIEIRRDILAEEDGPMLRYGLQKLAGSRLSIVPRSPVLRPGTRYLEQRYEMFRQAG